MKAKRLAFVYDAIYPYIMGGAEKRFYEIAKLLSQEGFDVHLYGMKSWEGPRVIKVDGITLHGICKSRSLYTKSGRRSIFEAFVFGLSCLKLLVEPFDVMDCGEFPYFSLFSCRLITWLRYKPLYATWHEVWGKEYWEEYLGRLSVIGWLIERLAMRIPDYIIAVSGSTANDLLGYGLKTPIHVIENGIDTEHIMSIKPSALKSEVVFTGRLLENKNVDVLIMAIAIVKNEYNNIICNIVGDGPERPSLEKLVRELGLQENINFTGFIEDHDELIAIMKASRVFVLPSTREGFGIVAIEANASGLPVVTVNAINNATRTLINSNNGIVTDLDDNSIANAIVGALIKPFPASVCIESARKYDWPEIVNKLKAVLV